LRDATKSLGCTNCNYYEWLKSAWHACIRCTELNDPLNLMHRLNDPLNPTFIRQLIGATPLQCR
jgi:hypothetical protein